MKRLFTLLLLTLLGMTYAKAQIVTERCWHLDKVQFLEHRQDFWRSHRLFSTTARAYSDITGGLYNITEGTYGFGLKVKSTPFSHHFAGVTTAFGWRFGSGLALGGGTGFLAYDQGLDDHDGGWMLPLFADVRFYFGRQKNKFFVMTDGGFLINFANFKDETRYFLNPGLGITIPMARSTQLSFAAGFYTQYDYNFFGRKVGIRDSFVNLRLGLLFGQ